MLESTKTMVRDDKGSCVLGSPAVGSGAVDGDIVVQEGGGGGGGDAVPGGWGGHSGTQDLLHSLSKCGSSLWSCCGSG